MSDQAHYPDLGSLIEQLMKRAKIKSQSQLASNLDVRDYDITRAKKLDASPSTQLKVARNIRAELADYLEPGEIGWLVQFEEWCKDQIDGIRVESWSDRWLRLQEVQEQGGVEQRQLTDEVPVLNPPLDRPKSVPHFVLRYEEDDKNELNLILKDLAPGQIVTLCGPHGIGKTALATEVIRALAPDDKPPERFPDGIIFHNFYRYPSADSALYQIAKVFGDAEPDKPTPRDAARRALWHRRALLVLDGVEQCDDLDKILNVSGQCGVLITTTSRADINGEAHIVETMPPDKSQLLLEAWSRVQIPDQAVAGQICKLVGYLPLALRIAGSYMFQRGLTASKYLELLKETPLEVLTIEERQHGSVPILIKTSLDRVSEAARRVMAVLGLLGLAPFDVQLISVALEISHNHAIIPLGELVSYSLLEWNGSRYQVSHSLIHTYVHTKLTVPNEILEKLAAYYTDLVVKESQSGGEKLDSERAHLMAVLLRCRDRELWDATMRLAQQVGEYLNRLKLWTELVATCEAGLAAAQALKIRQLECACLVYLGTAHANLGQVETAFGYFQQALVLAREVKDRSIESHCLADLGLIYSHFGHVETAIEHYQQALVIAKGIEDWRGEGNCLGNLGLAYHNLGQIETAIEYYCQALVAARETEDWHNASKHLSNLGVAYTTLGYLETAIDYLQQALVVSREIRDRSIEVPCLANLGIAYTKLGQIETAISYCEQALMATREIRYPRGEADCLHSLGFAYTALGKVETAIDYFQQALSIIWEIKDRRAESGFLYNLGFVYAKFGQVETAIWYYQQALVVSREIKDRLVEGRCLAHLGYACETLGQLETAISYCEQALPILREIKDQRNEVHCLAHIGNAYKTTGHIETAINYFQQALVVSREIKDQNNELQYLANLGVAYGTLGQMETAIDYFQQALMLAREVKDRRNEGIFLHNLGITYVDLGQIETAIDYFQQALAVRREMKDQRNEGHCLANLGNAYETLGQIETAIDYFQQALMLAREIEDRSLEAQMLITIIWIKSMRSENEGSAMAMLDEATRIHKSTQSAQGVIVALLTQGRIAWIQDHAISARQRWNEALTIATSTEDRILVTLARSYLALLEGGEGVVALIRDLLQFSDKECRDIGLDHWSRGTILHMLQADATGNNPK